MNIFLLENYQDSLCNVIDHLANTNIPLNKQVMKQLGHYKNTRRIATSKTQLRLYYKSIQHLKDNLTTDLAVNLLTFRMKQFALWFQYMWNNPSLCPKTFNRLSNKYPYNKTNFLRKSKILY